MTQKSSSILPTFTAKNWKKEVALSPIPILVDFRSASCHPILLHESLFENLFRNCGKIMKTGVMDVCEIMDNPTAERLLELPASCLFLNGKILKSATGFNRLFDLTSWWLREGGQWNGAKAGEKAENSEMV